MSESSLPLPLVGIRVLDLTQVVAGPYCTLMLADMGAEVVKIERPGHGDDLRRTMPYEGRQGHEDYFNALNRSKKSVALNLKDEAHQAIAVRLIGRADVLVENFAPGTAARLGVGWDVARRTNPRLVYCSLSGFGQEGPYAHRPAMDPIIQAMTGIMSVTGFPDGEPAMIGVPLADVISGMFAAYAIVNALRVVTDIGGGQYIDLSMQDAMLAALGIRMGETLQAGTSPTRLGNENPLRVPANTYRIGDGLYIAIIVHNEEQWRPFCEALDQPEWIAHPQFRTMPLRVQHREALNDLIARRFAEHASEHWKRRFEEHHLSYGFVNDYARALADPQIAYRGLIRELEHPRSGTIKVIGPPWQMSATQTRMTRPPVLGEHTEEVLKNWLRE
jgi:formyl-CoA transferase